MCILSVYTLLKVVCYYDLSVLFISVMGFQQKKFGWGLGGVSSIQFFWDFLNFFNFAKPLSLTNRSATERDRFRASTHDMVTALLLLLCQFCGTLHQNL